MREEYKQFERNVAIVKDAFASALARCDCEFLSHTPNLAETMASVAAFDFDENEIASGFCLRVGVDEAWHISTIDMQVAVYEWLEQLDMPKGALSKFKADVMKVYHHPYCAVVDGVNEKYAAVDTLNEAEYRQGLVGREWVRTEYKSRCYFRRLVSIARMACKSHAGEIATAATVTQPQQGAAIVGSCAAAGNVGGTADSLLNDNAAQFVTEYKPGASFRFRCNDCEGVTVDIQGLRNADISRVELLLTKDRYSGDGWCMMPDEWKRPCPSQYKAGSAARIFFSHLQSKRDVYHKEGFVDGNSHLFRLSPVVVKPCRGGNNKGAAGVGAGRGNKKE